MTFKYICVSIKDAYSYDELEKYSPEILKFKSLMPIYKPITRHYFDINEVISKINIKKFDKLKLYGFATNLMEYIWYHKIQKEITYFDIKEK
jgi:hypothetical protein